MYSGPRSALLASDGRRSTFIQTVSENIGQGSSDGYVYVPRGCTDRTYAPGGTVGDVHIPGIAACIEHLRCEYVTGNVTGISVHTYLGCVRVVELHISGTALDTNGFRDKSAYQGFLTCIPFDH